MEILYAMLPTITMCVGFYFGCKINSKDNVFSSIKNPIKIIQKKIERNEKNEEKEEIEEIERLNTILENIENYDGTGKNQKEVKYFEDNII